MRMCLPQQPKLSYHRMISSSPTLPKTHGRGGPTKPVGTETDPVVASLRRGYGTMKAAITNCKKEVFQSRFSKTTLDSLDEKLKVSFEGMTELRHRLAELPQLPTPDKNKIHEDFHIYDKLVKDARQDIQRHLNVLRQKEADQTRVREQK